MKFSDWLWELIDNSAYVMTIAACLLISFACMSVPYLQYRTLQEIHRIAISVRCCHASAPLVAKP
jgi:hypothetical protein